MYNLTKSKTLALAAIVTMAILIPGKAYSLGIGELKLHSGFNQNVKGEIELKTSANEDVSNLYVGLAAPEKFDEAGIPWSNFLKKIKFKPVKKANGTTVIELSSSESLKELFLSFVLEISWNKGNLLTREFAVLIDPETIPNSAAVSTGYKKKHFAENSSSFNETIGEKYTHQYGPTKRTDFIWKVAKKTHYRGVSIEQMIMALYANNPDAFYSDNINSLTARKMLDLPEKGVVLEMSRKEALAAVKQQNTEWWQRSASEKKLVPETASNSVSDNSQGTSGTRPTKKVADFSDNETHLKSVPKRKEKNSASIPNAESLALLDRLDRLEQKLDMMQTLLMKDKQPTLTIPAPTLSGDKPVPESAVEAKATPSVSSSERLPLPNSANNQNELVQKPESMQKQQSPTNPPITLPKTQKQPTTVLPPKSASKLISPSKSHLGFSLITLEKPATETTFISARQEDSERERFLIALLGLGGGLFLLGGFGSCFWWMRGKLRLTKAEIEKLSKYSSPAMSITPSDLKTHNELSFAAPADAFDSDRTDPVVEVDGLLSDGLYEEAEHLMRLTISFHPEVKEYHLKLLEVFVASKNKVAFYIHIAKLTGSGENHDLAFLQSIARMETELRSETVFDLAKLDKTTDTNAVANFEVTTREGVSFDLSHVAIESDAKAFDENDNNQSDFGFADNAQRTHKIEFALSDLITQSDHERVYETVDNQGKQSVPDNQTDSIHEIEFESTGFTPEPIAKRNIAKTDNYHSEAEWIHDDLVKTNEDSFDTSDFADDSAANEGIEFEDGEEEVGEENAADFFYFDTEPVAKLNSDGETATDNDRVFDLSHFYVEPDANTKN